MEEKKRVFTSIGVPVEVRDAVKRLALDANQSMYAVIERLVRLEQERIGRVQYISQTATKKR